MKPMEITPEFFLKFTEYCVIAVGLCMAAATILGMKTLGLPVYARGCLPHAGCPSLRRSRLRATGS
jgi:hypothetical protein